MSASDFDFVDIHAFTDDVLLFKGVKRKRAVMEEDTPESPARPLTLFNFQPRTPGARSRTQSAPHLVAARSERRPASHVRSYSFHRGHGLRVKALALSTADEDDEDDDHAQEEERPAKKPRISDVEPTPIPASRPATPEPVPAAVSRPSRVRPSRTYEERQLEVSNQIASKAKAKAVKNQSTASKAAGPSSANITGGKKTTTRSTSRKLKVEMVEEAVKKDAIKSRAAGRVTRAKAKAQIEGNDGSPSRM